MRRRQGILWGLGITGGSLAWLATASLLFLAVLGYWSAYPWPERLWMWAAYALEAPPNAIVHRWLIITGSVSALPLLGMLAILLFDRRRAGNGSVYGNTEWANRQQMAGRDILTTRNLP